MRTATLTGMMLVACTLAASAQQFTVLPQIGLEVSRTSLQYNNLASFTPANMQFSPQLGLRMDYTAKQGHGAFIGLATSRSTINYSFSEPATGMKDYSTSVGDLRLNFQAGYQFSTKPIYFKKSPAPVQTAKAVAPSEIRSSQSRCGRSYYSSRCSKYSRSSSRVAAQAVPKEKGWSLIVHPMAGVALTSPVSPGVSTKIESGQSVYQYEAGNWNTAIVTGAALEFGKNDVRKFTISMNCLRGIGNLGTSSIASTSNGKTTITNLRSDVATWNITAGIPLTIYKKKTAVKQVQMQAPPRPVHHNKSRFEGKCSRYRYQGII